MIKQTKLTLLVVMMGFFFACESQESQVSLAPVEDYLNSDGFDIVHDLENDVIHISPKGIDHVILSHYAGEFFRPYIHPIVAPDGRGDLTEFRPSHHPHQTALYFGFPLVNMRDFYHNPTGGGPWRGDHFWDKVSAEIVNDGTNGEPVSWQTVYNMLDVYGEVMITETQVWSIQRENDKYLLDIVWNGEAKRDITINRWEYGGLFLRMPWRDDINAEAVNSNGLRNGEAEGERALWVNLGLDIEGRDDFGNIAILDHPENRGHPNAWRVDSQLGINPATARFADWSIPEGETEVIRYRLVIYTGDFNHDDVTAAFEDFAGV